MGAWSLSEVLTRAADPRIAVIVTGAIVLMAWRSGSLSGRGALAALVVGLAALAVSWGWGAFLLGWFILASLLSRVGRLRKSARTAGIIAKGRRRDARQVLANGVVFALGAAGTLRWPAVAPQLALASAAALAAAGADTCSTEVGTFVGGRPWSLRTRSRVPVGTSGAVTLSGSLGGLIGSVILALLAWRCQVVPVHAVPALLAGAMVGAWTDTIAGAYWQERRWCPSCRQATEQQPHGCGAPTRQHGGLGGLDNDAVNFLCTVVGAAVAVALAR